MDADITKLAKWEVIEADWRLWKTFLGNDWRQVVLLHNKGHMLLNGVLIRR